MTMDADNDLPHGFSKLLHIQRPSLRVGNSIGLLLPTEVAEGINEARLGFRDDAHSPQAWDRACVYPTQAELLAVQAEKEDENDRCTPAKAFASAVPPVVGGSPGATPVSHAIRHQETPTRRRRVPGRAVAVFDLAQIEQRRTEVDLRRQLTSGEKKIELKLMDELAARGETRVVGLRPDWRARIANLRAGMPHMSEVIDRIEACCALSRFTRQPVRIPPLLLVGPPGEGKTYFARQLAGVLGVPEFVYQLESAETTSALTGSEKHWANSEVGQLFKLIVQTGIHANPVIVLDEIDKANGGRQYQPDNALHAVLDSVTSRQLRDKCIDFVFDASYVVYVATANDLSGIKPSLVSRFEVFHVAEPGPESALALARLISDQVMMELKVSRRFDPLDDWTLKRLATLKSPRLMHKMLTRAIGMAVVAGRSLVQASDFPGDGRGAMTESGAIDAAQRIALVTRIAIPVLGSEDAVERWLAAPAIGLDQRKPVDVIRTDPGLIAVMTLLTRMDYGVYT